MAIQTVWDNEEKTILCSKLENQWSMDDFNTAFDIVVEMMAEIDHNFVYIFDMTKSDDPPARFMSVGRKLKQQSHPKSKKTIFIRASRLVRVMIQIMDSLSNNSSKITFAHDMEEARTIAQQTLEHANLNS